MNPGDPVWYRQFIRGGYGFGQDVPGEFVRATKRRISVRLWRKDGTRVTVHLAPQNVRPRDPDAVWR